MAAMMATVITVYNGYLLWLLWWLASYLLKLGCTLWFWLGTPKLLVIFDHQYLNTYLQICTALCINHLYKIWTSNCVNFGMVGLCVPHVLSVYGGCMYTDCLWWLSLQTWVHSLILAWNIKTFLNLWPSISHHILGNVAYSLHQSST